ncbi:MAG: hypothetical protein J5608_01635 [Alphaproteobacteria bacterium]|nr:hypothetical protein [Alphaproteobacteria bacterium]
MVVKNETKQEKQLFVALMDKIKKSETLTINKAPGTKYLSRRVFKFDKFDMRVSFEHDNSFIKYAAYGRVDIDNRVLNKPHEIVDITVIDKQGKVVVARNCLRPISETGSVREIQQVRFDMGKAMYDLLLKRSQAIAVKNDEVAQLKHATSMLKRVNKLKSMQQSAKTATLDALDRIKEL